MLLVSFVCRLFFQTRTQGQITISFLVVVRNEQCYLVRTRLGSSRTYQLFSWFQQENMVPASKNNLMAEKHPNTKKLRRGLSGSHDRTSVWCRNWLTMFPWVINALQRRTCGVWRGVWYSTIQYSTVQYNTVLYPQYIVLLYSTVYINKSKSIPKDSYRINCSNIMIMCDNFNTCLRSRTLLEEAMREAEGFNQSKGG